MHTCHRDEARASSIQAFRATMCAISLDTVHACTCHARRGKQRVQRHVECRKDMNFSTTEGRGFQSDVLICFLTGIMRVVSFGLLPTTQLPLESRNFGVPLPLR